MNDQELDKRLRRLEGLLEEKNRYNGMRWAPGLNDLGQNTIVRGNLQVTGAINGGPINGGAGILTSLNLNTTGAGTGSLNMTGSIRQSQALGVHLINTGGQVIGSGVMTALTFDTLTDTYNHSGTGADMTDPGMWGGGTNVYCKSPGWYMAGMGLSFGNHAAAWRLAGSITLYRSDGTNPIQMMQNEIHVQAGVNAYMSCCTGMFYMHLNDYAIFSGYQNTGVNKTTIGAIMNSVWNGHNAFLARVA